MYICSAHWAKLNIAFVFDSLVVCLIGEGGEVYMLLSLRVQENIDVDYMAVCLL